MAKRIILACLLLLLLVAGVWRLVLLRQQKDHATSWSGVAPEPDPRLAYDGPFKNVFPSIKYIGDDRCVACHDDIAETFRLHPMGHSLARLDQVRDEALDEPKYNAPFERYQSRLSLERHGKHAV